MFGKHFLITLVAIAMLPFAPVSHASLVGDSVDAGIFDFDGNRVFGFGLDNPFTVAADDSDLKTYSDLFTLDVHAEGFTIDYFLDTPPSRSWQTGVEFRLFDLDWVDSPTGIITGINIDHNLPGWDISRASFGDDFVILEWGDVVLNGNLFVEVSLITDHAVVPLPAAAWLFGSALLGLVGFGRLRRAGQAFRYR